MRRFVGITALLVLALSSLGSVALAAAPADADCAREALECCGADCPACFCCAGAIPAIPAARPSHHLAPTDGRPATGGFRGATAHPWPILHVPRITVPS